MKEMHVTKSISSFPKRVLIRNELNNSFRKKNKISLSLCPMLLYKNILISITQLICSFLSTYLTCDSAHYAYVTWRKRKKKGNLRIYYSFILDNHLSFCNCVNGFIIWRSSFNVDWNKSCSWTNTNLWSRSTRTCL